MAEEGQQGGRRREAPARRVQPRQRAPRDAPLPYPALFGLGANAGPRGQEHILTVADTRQPSLNPLQTTAMARTSDDDPGYAALPLALRRRIDDAFDSALLSTRSSSPHPKRRKLSCDQASAPGGFLLDDPAPGGFLLDGSPPSGGFLPDEPTQSNDEDDEDGTQGTHIPLSLIPSALQVLDLEPDDEDVLSVFRNAASGWNERSARDPSDARVSRKDWRAVCAALLDPGSGRDDVEMDVDQARTSGSEADVAAAVSASDSGEEYVQSLSSASDGPGDDSDDDYREGGFLPAKTAKGKGGSKTNARSTRARRGRARDGERSEWSEGGEEDGGGRQELSLRQKKESRAAFALFFADVPDALLDRQRIRIEDITRVAALLKEKMSAQEVIPVLLP